MRSKGTGMRKVLIGGGVLIMLLAMSATAVMAAKPAPTEVVSGGATLVDDFNFPNRSINVSMFANEATQSGHLTLQAIEDGANLHFGFVADLTCVNIVLDDVDLGTNVAAVVGTITSGTGPDFADATGRIIRRAVVDGSPDRSTGGFVVGAVDADCFLQEFKNRGAPGFPHQGGASFSGRFPAKGSRAGPPAL